MNRYFYCYSYPLKEHFVKNGLRYITAATNQSTGKRYWLNDIYDIYGNLSLTK